jgi:hypothetical protein
VQGEYKRYVLGDQLLVLDLLLMTFSYRGKNRK